MKKSTRKKLFRYAFSVGKFENSIEFNSGWLSSILIQCGHEFVVRESKEGRFTFIPNLFIALSVYIMIWKFKSGMAPPKKKLQRIGGRMHRV